MRYEANTQMEPSLGELFATLSDQAGRLLRQEVELAQAEMTRKMTRARRGATLVGAGAVAGMGAFYALVAATILLLSRYMATWLAASLVGLVLALVAFAVVQNGINKLKAIDPAPRQTIETMRENKEWLTEQI